MKMGIHKNSKAEEIRKYARQNPNATRDEIAERTGVKPQRVSNVLSIAKRKAKTKRAEKKAVPILRPISAGIKLEGGYYSLEKLKDIVDALETLNKLMAKKAND
jgi:hypothetical protein